MSLSRDEEGHVTLGGVPLASVAKRAGTPAYVYDLDGMAREAHALAAAFEGAPHLVAYAVKANSAGAIVRELHGAGCGADVVSGAELALARACGVPPDAILFSGVAKRGAELDAAIAEGLAGILAIQIESVEEIPRVAARARAAGRRARISLRVNPASSLEALATHAHIATGHDDAKFGIPKDDLHAAFALLAASPELALVGLSTHVGSQFTSTGAYVDAARTLFELAVDVRASQGRWKGGRELRFVDTGGGFGVDYGEGCAASPADFVRETRALQRSLGLADLALHVEPGRSLVATHGVLLASVIQQKVTPHLPASATGSPTTDVRRRWLMIDAGMNDLLRPALYQARHRVVAVDAARANEALAPWRVVGPVCESADDFGDHVLPVEPPRLVAILDAGAYGYTMASRYNGRPLPAEVFLRGGEIVSSTARDADAVWVVDRAGR